MRPKRGALAQVKRKKNCTSLLTHIYTYYRYLQFKLHVQGEVVCA